VRLLGEIVRLQVQASSLKVGEAPHKRYDPAPLTPVPRLIVEPGGVTGQTDWDEDLIDVHHRAHPATKHRAGSNGVSLLFTDHYRAMRDRFGPHLTDGIAGENVLVALDAVVGSAEVAGGLTIEGGDGRRLALAPVIVAAPCVEFARYALRFPDEARPDRTVTEAVRFLDAGMRGYYAAYAGPSAFVQIGDRVYSEE
jgi:hypothetical protein